jgi:hypothetical protein
MQRTLEEVLEVVGWRGRADRDVKPTVIGVPSAIMNERRSNRNNIINYLVEE